MADRVGIEPPRLHREGGVGRREDEAAEPAPERARPALAKRSRTSRNARIHFGRSVKPPREQEDAGHGQGVEAGHHETGEAEVARTQGVEPGKEQAEKEAESEQPGHCRHADRARHCGSARATTDIFQRGSK